MTGDDHQDELDLDLPAEVVTGEAETGAGPRDGLSWTCDLDIETLLAAVTGPAHWTRGPVTAPVRPDPAAGSDSASDPEAPSLAPAPEPVSPATSAAGSDADPRLDLVEAEWAEYLEAVDGGRSQVMPLPVVAGRVAEMVPAGPELAGWLGAGGVGGLEDGALAGIAASYRRLASWAQAGELAAVAELASRSAAADDRIGTGDGGRPARISPSACAEVSLALTMSQAAASWWADLAVTLRWRLAATGAALASGAIDLARARAIADATAFLEEDTARAVQDRVLPKAGTQTTAQLRAALRRAVIAADPAGADRRREEAEKQARVLLYPDTEGTASLGGYSLPGIPAAAALARITALAAALKASGAGGGIDRLRAHVFLGLLLGTLPYIPPPEHAPPDQPPGNPDDSHTDDEPPDGRPPGDGPPGDGPGGGHPDCGLTNDGTAGSGYPGGSLPEARPPDDESPGGDPQDVDPPSGNLAQDRAPRGRVPTGPHPGRTSHSLRGQPGDDTTDAQDDEDEAMWARPPPAWPEVPAFLQTGPAAMNHLIPAPSVGGLLDLRLPWTTLTGQSPQPGHLSRTGPITPGQARHLAHLAATDPGTRWRIILTHRHGHAIATTTLTRPATRHHQAGLIKHVTVTLSPDDLSHPQPDGLPPALRRILTVARHLADHAARRAARDTQADGCAHDDETASYRPTTRLRDYITARDLTCRFPTCRQPVWRCDLDHTTPFDQGGRTCICNLGGLCRFHHQVKGHTHWHLDQPAPGTFTWTTPTGRRYTTQPDAYAA